MNTDKEIYELQKQVAVLTGKLNALNAGLALVIAHTTQLDHPITRNKFYDDAVTFLEQTAETEARSFLNSLEARRLAENRGDP